PDRDLVGREGRMAVDEIGEVHHGTGLNSRSLRASTPRTRGASRRGALRAYPRRTFPGPSSLVRFARLVQRLAPEPVEADFGRPRQHERAAAAVAVDALERQALQHGLAAAGADRLGRDRVGVL